MIGAIAMLPEELRADLRKKFARAPAPVGPNADECADIVFHAVSEALASLERVTARAPIDRQLAITAIAIGTAASVFQSIQDALCAAMAERMFGAQAAGADQ